LKQSTIIIVGHNENYEYEQKLVSWLRKTKDISGSYGRYALRSVQFSDGRSYSYPYLINMALEQQTGSRIETLANPLIATQKRYLGSTSPQLGSY